MSRPARIPSGRLAALCVVLLAAGVTGCDITGGGIAPVTMPLSAVVVAPETDSVRAGESSVFTAAAYDTLGAMVTGVAYTWSSGDPAVFTVSGNGRVTAVAEGAANLVVESNGVRDTARVFVYADTGWVFQSNPSSGASLNAVCFRPDGRRGWAVGDGGTMLRTTNAGAGWLRVSVPTTFDLNGVWFTGDADGWAVGNGGVVLRTTDGGVSWRRLTNVTAGVALHDVCFTSPTTGFAVGANGTVLRTTNAGGSWTQTTLPTGFALRSVAFGSALDGWAVGTNGVIAATHDGGDSWAIVPSVTTQALTGVWPTGAASAFAAGAQGVAARTSAPGSDTWELAPSLGAFNAIEGLHFPTATTGFAVGANAGGIVLRTLDGGATWAPQAPRTAVRLLDVWFVDTKRGWAVGESGVIVHTSSGGGAF